MKVKWLDRALLIGPYFCLCQSEAQYHAAMKNLEVPRKDRNKWLGEHAYATAHFQISKNDLCVIVCINMPDKTALQICAILVHEAVHIWQRYKRHIGEESPGDETEAYAIQNISQSLFEAYRMPKKKRNK